MSDSGIAPTLRERVETLMIRPTDSGVIQLFRYAFVGGLAFVADFGTLVFASRWMGIHYQICGVLGFAVGLATNYLLSIAWVFRSKADNKLKEFVLFAVIGVAGLALNAVILWMGNRVGLLLEASKIISTIVVFFWNFLARKKLVF